VERDRAAARIGRALDVGVLDAEDERAARLARPQPVEQRGARAADVEVAGRRRCKSEPDHGCGNSPLSGGGDHGIKSGMKVNVARLLKTVGKVLAVIVGLFLLMQAVPYGRTHGNPPTSREPAWDSVQTRELAKRA